MKIKGKKSCPPGIYAAKFMGVETNEHEQYGAGLVWGFEVIKGVQKGVKVARTTKDEASPQNSCGQFVHAVAGVPLKEVANAVENIDLDDFVGGVYQISVQETKSGGTRVESVVMRLNDDGSMIEDDDAIGR